MVLGIKVDDFGVPVCNSFKAKILEDQLCYSVDPNHYRNLLDKKNDLELTLYINYNEDREFHLSLEEEDLRNDRSVIAETIGKNYFRYDNPKVMIFRSIGPVYWKRIQFEQCKGNICY